MKVLVIGDSFGLPRSNKSKTDVEVYFEDTYPEQLRQLLQKANLDEDLYLMNGSKYANNSLQLMRDADKILEFFVPDYIVLQLGIVDCWERPKIVSGYENFLEKDPWVSKEEYVFNIANFIRKAIAKYPVSKFVLVNITHATFSHYEKYPKSEQRTREYNEQLVELVDEQRIFLADVYEDFCREPDLLISSDGVHPNRIGNLRMATRIAQTIQRIQEQELHFNSNRVEQDLKIYMLRSLNSKFFDRWLIFEKYSGILAYSLFDFVGNCQSAEVAIFGGGITGHQVYNFIQDSNQYLGVKIRAKYFIDNDPSKWGEKLCDLKVIGPDMQLLKSLDRVIIASSASVSITKQLISLGYPLSKVIVAN